MNRDFKRVEAKRLSLSCFARPAKRVNSFSTWLLEPLSEANASHLCQGFRLQVLDHRRDQALGSCRCETDVDVVPVDHLIGRVVDVGVQCRDLLQGMSTRQEEGRLKAQLGAVRSLEDVLVLLRCPS